MVFDSWNKQDILLLSVFHSSVTLVKNPMTEQEATHNYYSINVPWDRQHQLPCADNELSVATHHQIQTSLPEASAFSAQFVASICSSFWDTIVMRKKQYASFMIINLGWHVTQQWRINLNEQHIKICKNVS